MSDAIVLNPIEAVLSMVGAAWRWREPAFDTIKREKAWHGGCSFCGEHGTILLRFSEDDGESVRACRECTSLRHASLMDPKEWLAVPCEASQDDMLHASRLLSSVEESLVEMLGDQENMKKNPSFGLDIEHTHSLSWNIFKHYRKEIPKAIAVLERARDRLLPVRAHMLSLARVHERSCWLLHGVHPLHPSAPREGLVYWYAGTACYGSMRISNLLKHAFPHWDETDTPVQALDENEMQQKADEYNESMTARRNDALPEVSQSETDAAREKSDVLSDFIDQLCRKGKEGYVPSHTYAHGNKAPDALPEYFTKPVMSVNSATSWTAIVEAASDLISTYRNATFSGLMNLSLRNLDYLHGKTWLSMTREENERVIAGVLDAMKASLLMYCSNAALAQPDAAAKENGNGNGEDADTCIHANMAYLRFEIMVEDALKGIGGNTLQLKDMAVDAAGVISNHLVGNASEGAGGDDTLSQPDRAGAVDESRS